MNWTRLKLNEISRFSRVSPVIPSHWAVIQSEFPDVRTTLYSIIDSSTGKNSLPRSRFCLVTQRLGGGGGAWGQGGGGGVGGGARWDKRESKERTTEREACTETIRLPSQAHNLNYIDVFNCWRENVAPLKSENKLQQQQTCIWWGGWWQ